jgi:hypothetical protein
LPSGPVVTGFDEKVTSPFVEKATAAPATGLGGLLPSTTVAVAVECDAPSAGMREGDSTRVVVLAVPDWVSVAIPLTVACLLVVAVIVFCPGELDDLIVAV